MVLAYYVKYAPVCTQSYTLWSSESPTLRHLIPESNPPMLTRTRSPHPLLESDGYVYLPRKAPSCLLIWLFHLEN